MITGDPRPARRAGKHAQHFARFWRQPPGSGLIVEAVAEAPDFPRLQIADERADRVQGREAVVGREHLPMLRVPACLLEMQIGKQQRPPRRPVQRGFGQHDQLMTTERKGNHATRYAVRREAFQ